MEEKNLNNLGEQWCNWSNGGWLIVLKILHNINIIHLFSICTLWVMPT